jgi:hypothetical protein
MLKRIAHGVQWLGLVERVASSVSFYQLGKFYDLLFDRIKNGKLLKETI